MALQVNVTVQGGLTATNAYVRITDIVGFKNYNDGKYYMTIGTKAYKDETEAGKPAPIALATTDIDRAKCEYSLTGADNALVQAYNYLKTLDLYSGASDT